MRHLYAVAFLVLSIVASLSMGAGASASFTANVSVFCPYNVVVNLLPNYPITGNVASSFSVQSLSSECTSPPTSGFITIINNNNDKIAFQNSITVNEINSVLTNYDFQFPTSNLTNTIYNAKVNLTSTSYTNSSSPTFAALNPPRLVISNFSVSPSSPSKGSAVSFFADISNEGQYATANIPFNLTVSGPAAGGLNVVLPALSPFQEENVIIQLSGLTGQSGTYSATAAANTLFNGIVIRAVNQSASYTVPGGGGGGGGGSSNSTPTGPPAGPSIVQMPQLTVVSAPLFTSLVAGTSAIYSMSFQSSSTSPELIAFNIGAISFQGATFAPAVSESAVPKAFAKPADASGNPAPPYVLAPVAGSRPTVLASASPYSGLVTLSTKSLVLGPGQSSTINLFFNAPANATPGTYVIALNVSVTAANRTTSQLQYVTFNIFSSSTTNPSILNQVTLTNNTHTASGVIKITSPYNTTTSNFTLQTLLPIGVAFNASQIIAYGAPSTITVKGGYYVITWNIGYLPVGQQIYAYYSINNPQNQQLLQRVHNVFVAPQAVSPQNLLKVLNINIPTYYTNYTNNIAVTALYTGTTQTQVTFTLNGPPGIQISDSSQIILANPNQLLAATFKVTSSMTPGTNLLSLTITQGNSTLTYSIPVVVLPQQAPSTTSVQPIHGAAFNISRSDIEIGGGVAVVLVLAYVLIRIGERGISRPRYSKDRSEQLIRIREQIKRSDQIE